MSVHMMGKETGFLEEGNMTVLLSCSDCQTDLLGQNIPWRDVARTWDKFAREHAHTVLHDLPHVVETPSHASQTARRHSASESSAQD